MAPPIVVTPLLTLLGAEDPSGQNVAASPPHTSSVGVVEPKPQMCPAKCTASCKNHVDETHGTLLFFFSFSRFDYVLFTERAQSEGSDITVPTGQLHEDQVWHGGAVWPPLRGY